MSAENENVARLWDLVENGQYKEAIDELSNLKSHTFHTCYLAGIAKFQLNDFAGSMEGFQQAAATSQQDIDRGYLHYWIGRVHAAFDFFLEERNPHYDVSLAKDNFEIAISKAQFPADTYHQLAEIYKVDEEKVALYETAIVKMPGEASLFFSLFRLYKKTGSPGKGGKILQQATNAGIRSATIELTLGMEALENGGTQLAGHHFQLALEFCNTHLGKQAIHYYRGVVFFRLAEFTKGAEQFLTGLNLAPYSSLSWLLRAALLICALKQRKRTQAEQFLDTIETDRELLENIGFRWHSCRLDVEETVPIGFEFETEDIARLISFLVATRAKQALKLKVELILASLFAYKNETVNELDCYRAITTEAIQYPFIEQRLESLYSELLDKDSTLNDALTRLKEDFEKPRLSLKLLGSIFNTASDPLFTKQKDYALIIKLGKWLENWDGIPEESYFRYAYSLAEMNKPELAKKYYERIILNHPKNTAALNNLAVIIRDEKNLTKAASLFRAASRIEPSSALYKKNLANIEKLIGDHIEKEKQQMIPAEWQSVNDEVNVGRLDSLSFFALLTRINKVKKTYRHLFERDFKELTINYLNRNAKSTIVMSGGLVELALIYFCEKRKINNLDLQENGKTIRINLFKANLNQLITYADGQGWFGNDFHLLGHLSRIYRNFIHPGIELKNGDAIESKAELCYLSTIEILKKILG